MSACTCSLKEILMRPSKRFSVNKRRSGKSFSRGAARTKVMNVHRVSRGGIRL